MGTFNHLSHNYTITTRGTPNRLIILYRSPTISSQYKGWCRLTLQNATRIFFGDACGKVIPSEFVYKWSLEYNGGIHSKSIHTFSEYSESTYFCRSPNHASCDKSPLFGTWRGYFRVFGVFVCGLDVRDCVYCRFEKLLRLKQGSKR